MRILVISDLPQFVTGGAEVQAARLIESWLDAGHEVVCLGRRMGRGPVTLGRHRVAVARIRSISSFGRWIRGASYFLSLCWLLLRNRGWADLVYIRFLGEAAATTAILKNLRLLRVPVVSTPANTLGDGDIRKLSALPLGRHVVRLLDRRIDAINLIAGGMAQELRTAGFSGHNFSFIPNGIPIAVLADNRDEATNLKFLAVGRLSEQKGYDVLIRAAASLRNRLGPGQLRIIGDGPEAGRLRALAAECKVSHLIEWGGELSQDQVRNELEKAHVFLLPSRYEGMSNAGLEAMERGLPLVISRCEGLDRYVDASIGWVVPPEDVSALAAAMDQALAEGMDRLLEMGAAARRCVVQNFDMKVVGAKYVALFHRLRGPYARHTSD